jgi:hypothetical protein
MLNSLTCLLSDLWLFPLLQVGLVTFAVWCFLAYRFHIWRAGGAGVELKITRSPVSMGVFYASYAAVNGLVVSLDLGVDIARFIASSSCSLTLYWLFIFVY